MTGVERPITGYHLDDEGDWVAELACGHDQHVRHRPPFQERSWVLTAAGRTGRLGQPLACPPCDRAEPPGNLRPVRTMPEWDEESLPGGLRRSHRLGRGTWGRIRVRQGTLRFSMAGDPPVAVDLEEGSVQSIPPETDHRVEPIGSVRFTLETLTVDRSSGSPRDAGGDPACWADRVCSECGAVLDGSPHRPGCTRPGSDPR